MSDLVLTAQRETIFEITLNRPDKRNAINLDVWRAFDEAVQQANRTPGIRAVLIRGAGKSFSAGIDVSTFMALAGEFGPHWQARMRSITDMFQAVLNRLERLELPTIALLQGHCLGLAMELALACDMRIAAAHTLISPDICICADCLRELFDPSDRRYRYPFINCTNCGPRFTIIKDIPYDRPLTTMATFPLCPACQAEYEDPLNRRFHAQPNACPVCGPHLWLEMSDKLGVAAATGDTALRHAQQLLAEGRIVAVKGIGGFHLACDALNNEAVALLRQRKGRVDKPLAVMALDVATVRRFAELSSAEEAWLTSKERPILLLKEKPTCPLSRLIAPGNDHIGVMLPYSPLHYLLLSDLPTLPGLVMTSGNYSQEPIVKDVALARPQLAPLADAFLLHNRDICGRCDDSVLRLVALTDQPTLMPLRRSRGYAPFPVKLPVPVPPLLAVGGELKATFCLAQEHHAYMS